MDEWILFDELEHGAIGPTKLIDTLANAGSAICGSNGLTVHPNQLIPGAPRRLQTDAEQQAIAQQITAIYNAGL